MSPIYTETHWSAALAIAVSWKPTPVRSAIVICAIGRPARLAAGDDLAELGVDVVARSAAPASSACFSSPNAAHCAKRSTTTRSARREALGVELLLARRIRSERGDVHARLAATRRARAALRDGVAVMSTSAARHTSSGARRGASVEALGAASRRSSVEVRRVGLQATTREKARTDAQAADLHAAPARRIR